jgi:hypothetical protein
VYIHGYIGIQTAWLVVYICIISDKVHGAFHKSMIYISQWLKAGRNGGRERVLTKREGTQNGRHA